MVNSLYTAAQVASTAATLIGQPTGLLSIATRNFETDFSKPGVGKTVNVKVPASLVARTRDVDSVDAIVLDSLTESTFPVTLDTHAYSAVGLTEGDLKLRLVDFNRQVTVPQADAIYDYVDQSALAAVNGVGGLLTGETLPEFDPENPRAYFIAARKVLVDRKINVAVDAIVGTAVFAALLNDKTFLSVAESGSDATLRDAQIGRFANMNVQESTGVADTEIIFIARGALAVTIVAPAVLPDQFNSVQTVNGISVRYLRDYDATHMTDRSVLSTFVGSTILPFKRVVRSYSGTIGASTVTVPAALKVDTAA